MVNEMGTCAMCGGLTQQALSVMRMAANAILRIRELHQPDGEFCSICYWDDKGNRQEYPCPTINALEATQ